MPRNKDFFPHHSFFSTVLAILTDRARQLKEAKGGPCAGAAS